MIIRYNVNRSAKERIYGRLAQLVEHPLDVRRVSGSSPLSSTMKTPRSKERGVFSYIRLSAS